MSPALPPALRAVLDRLVAGGRHAIGLDELGDAVAALPVGWADLDALLTTLEEQGIEIVQPETPPLRNVLGATLAATRALQAELGRRPTLDEIAGRAGQPVSAVRAALLYARVLMKGT